MACGRILALLVAGAGGPPTINETSAGVYVGSHHSCKYRWLPAPATNQMTIKGTLDYQACDDRLCYLPTSVPFQWTLRVAGE